MKNNNNINKNVNSVDTNENKNNNGDDFMKKTNKKEFKKLSKTKGYELYSIIYEFAEEMKIELDKAWELFEEAKYNAEEAKKLAKEAEARAKEAEARAEKAEATANEGQDIVQKIENKIDECTKETEAYDSMANRFTKEGDGFHNYQRKHGKEIPYAQHIVTELENKLRNGEGNKYELMAELNIARKDLKQKEELYANAEEERRTCKTAATRALKEANSIRNGELRDAENDLRTIKNILAKY